MQSERPASIPALLERNVAVFGDRPAYREKEYGIWQSWTWAEAGDQIEALALGFLEIGLSEGDHVAIIGRNRPHFYWTMVAAQMVGAVPVPVYQDSVAEELAYVLDHCGARFAVVEDQEQVDKTIEIKDRLTNLAEIIYVDKRGLRKYDHSHLTPFNELQDMGRAARERHAAELRRRRDELDENSTCVMLYTSGTTGRPKGVVLSNRNIIETSRASAEFDRLSEAEVILAYLPMAWVGDFIFSVGQAYWCGFCVCCPESPTTMYENLHEIGPTYFFAPPRVFGISA